MTPADDPKKREPCVVSGLSCAVPFAALCCCEPVVCVNSFASVKVFATCVQVWVTGEVFFFLLNGAEF